MTRQWFSVRLGANPSPGGVIQRTHHPTNLDISLSTRTELAQILERLLATSFDLASQVKQAHWNIRGPSFASRHELFDRIAAHAREMADTIAERIGALGFRACRLVSSVEVPAAREV